MEGNFIDTIYCVYFMKGERYIVFEFLFSFIMSLSINFGGIEIDD